MRILFPVHLFPPHHRAGVEAYTLQLAHAMRRRADVAVATTRKIISLPTGKIRRRRHEGLEVFEVVNNLAFDDYRDTWSNAAMERAFRSILEEVAPEVVHFQHLMNWSVGCPGIARERGARVFMTLHDFWLMCARFGQLVGWDGKRCEAAEEARCSACMAATPWGQPPAARRWIDRLVTVRRYTGIPLDEPMRWLKRRTSRSKVGVDGAPPASPPAAEVDAWRPRFRERREGHLALAESCHKIVTPSNQVRDTLVAWGLDPEAIVRVPQGLDPALFSGIPARPSREGRPLRLAFIGQIAPHKGVHLLVEAVKRLPRKEVTLSVYGPDDHHPDYAAGCRSRAADHGNIAFGGLLKREELRAVYADVDVLCVPSTWNECCPLTIQESFMAGAPAVVTGMGGMAELVTHEVNGLHVRCGDVDDWERQLRRLIEEPGLWDALRASLPEVPTIDEHVDALCELYGS